MGIIAPAPQSRQEDSLTLCQNRLVYAANTAVTDGSEISEVCCNRTKFISYSCKVLQRAGWLPAQLGSECWLNTPETAPFYRLSVPACFHARYGEEDRFPGITYWLSNASTDSDTNHSACVSLARANCMAMHKFKVAERAQKARNRGELRCVRHRMYSACEQCVAHSKLETV